MIGKSMHTRPILRLHCRILLSPDQAMPAPQDQLPGSTYLHTLWWKSYSKVQRSASSARIIRGDQLVIRCNILLIRKGKIKTQTQQQQARQEHTDQMYHTSRVSSGPLSYASILKSGNVPAQHRLHDFQAN